jgi:hypothetical protein
MDLDTQLAAAGAPPEPRKREKKEREERPKNSLSDNLPYRIDGLEKAKAEQGMTQADIAALDRSIAKLKEKLAEQNERKPQQ